ncbi:MAG: hypothetical protein L7V86_10430 [Verrucomicrobiales bacterium]|jgi:hypothetical protein|nr:hypothetical protein [Verrucomicrobiales bacterium]
MLSFETCLASGLVEALRVREVAPSSLKDYKGAVILLEPLKPSTNHLTHHEITSQIRLKHQQIMSQKNITTGSAIPHPFSPQKYHTGEQIHRKALETAILMQPFSAGLRGFGGT